MSGNGNLTARERVGVLFSDGQARTPAMVARDLGCSPESARKLVVRMLRAGQLETHGDGWYYATAATLKRLAQHAARRTGPPSEPAAPVVIEHIQHLRRRGLRESSITQRRREINRLGRWLAAHGTDLLDATAEQLITFCDARRGAQGRRLAINNVSGFYRWAHEIADLIGTNPARKLIRPKHPEWLPRPIDEDRLAVALEQADSRTRAWLVLAAFCGLRAGEIARVHRDDLRTDGRSLLVHGKGGRQRVVPLPQVAADALAPYTAAGTWLWPGQTRAGHISANHVSKATNRYLRSCGIPDTLHSLRHRYGTKLYELSLDLRLVQDLMGHASPRSTAIYTKVNPRAGAEIAAQLPIPSAREPTHERRTASTSRRPW